MAADTRERSTLDESMPFMTPIPDGCTPCGGIDILVCDHDHYYTGDPERENGCGGTYYVRSYINPHGMMESERTPCKCMIPIMQKMEQERAQAEIKARKDYLGNLAVHYFGDYDMMRDESYNMMAFPNYKPGHPSQQHALETLMAFEVGAQSILLYGAAGRGKTHLALAVARAAKQKGNSVLALKVIDLLTRLRRVYGQKDEMIEANIMRVLKNVDLLVIDDIGVEKSTDWVLSKFYEIIDYRHRRRSTVFTTNLSGKQMHEKEGMALVSRIWGSEIRLELDGKDWRVAGR